MMPRSLSIAAAGFSVIGILVLPAPAVMLGSRALQAAADELMDDKSAAPAAGAIVEPGGRTLPGIDRMMLPPGWSILPEAKWTAPHPAAERPPAAAAAWKEIRGEIPAGWTGAGILAGSGAPPPRFAPAEPVSGADARWTSRFSPPSTASGR